MNDHDIIELIRNPSSREAGFRDLVVRYQERLYQMIIRRVGSHEDADDILQNTFIKIFRHIESFEGRAELFTWMYRIAGNEVINFQKRNQRKKTIELDPSVNLKADAYIDEADIAPAMEKMIAALPERQQMVFRMRYYDELSYKEISEILQLTEGALKASFHHAVKKIAEGFRAKQIL